MMSQRSKGELVAAIHPHYLKASKTGKHQILNEFVAATGYHRKYAIRLLKHGFKPKGRKKVGRSKVYQGEMEMDLVAHCGDTTAGQYLNTLTATDVSTGWTKCLALGHKTQAAVSQAISDLRQHMPFPLLGIDSDNGSEFINDTLYRYCLSEQITFTRSRPYRKNDQAHVEQKNWSVVRHTVGYDRLETEDERTLLDGSLTLEALLQGLEDYETPHNG